MKAASNQPLDRGTRQMEVERAECTRSASTGSFRGVGSRGGAKSADSGPLRVIRNLRSHDSAATATAAAAAAAAQRCERERRRSMLETTATRRSSVPPPQPPPPQPPPPEKVERTLGWGSNNGDDGEESEGDVEEAASDAVASAGRRSAAAGGVYTQMPMRVFMSHKDWRQLLEKRNSGKLAKCQTSGSKYNRMLYSYHRLYQEYQYLCTCLLPRTGCAGGPKGGRSGGEGDGGEEQTTVVFGPDALVANNASAGAAVLAGTAASSTPAAVAATAASVFDSVLIADRNFKVQRCKKRRSVVCHRVLTQSTEGTTVWLDVPIAVELLLPRLQEQIKTIMSACPHLPDPLEVLAELRVNRYDTDRCVEYLRETLPLREVVRDILTVRSGRCLDAARAAADRRDLRCRVAGLEAQLRAASSQLLKDGSSCGGDNNGGGGCGGGGGGSGGGGGNRGGDDLLSGRVRRLVASLDAVKSLVDSVGSPSPQQQQQKRQQQLEQRPQTHWPRRQLRKQQQQPLPAETVGDATPPAEDGGGRPLLRGVRQLRDDIRVVRTSLKSVAAAMSAGLSKVRSHLSVQHERSRRSRDGSAKHQATVARLQRYVDELRTKCKDEEARRRLVFNALQEQLGNIRVYCRCTRIDGDQAVVTVGAESLRVRGQQQDEFFRFDRVFGPDAPQESLFEELQPLITSFLDGYNVCFITYGGEASGKTFTLLGSSKQRGLVYRALLAVLKEAASRATDWSLELDSACMEIYNDACFDLLADRSAVSLYRDCGLGSVFAALQQTPIREERDVFDLMRVCAVRRRVAKTALNPKSSRSHLVHLVRLQARSRLHGHTACSYLGMMDLAGAENIIKADTWHEPERAAEAGHINRSLAAFNRLFLMLRRTPPSAACYREARLTQMLKPFLVNHGKCCIIVTVRTDQSSVSTTMSTLRFGRDARQVALGKAQRQLLNVD